MPRNKFIIFLFVGFLMITVVILTFIVQFPVHHLLDSTQVAISMNRSFSILSANVGNISLKCHDVLNKLCDLRVERALRKNIQLLRPDIIVLQEVLAPWQCEVYSETRDWHVCSLPQNIPQARRLVGDGYTIVCNTRNEFECVAVRVDVGEIVGCAPNEYCVAARTNQPIDGCDNGFNVSAVTVRLADSFVFDLVNAHPQSTDVSCRAQMIKQIFSASDGTQPLLQNEFCVIAGDFNLDPWRDNNVSVDIWNHMISQGWMGRPFIYHSGEAEIFPPYYTTRLFVIGKTVDMIISNFAQGVCAVLGETPGTARLDGGSGTDHRALFGRLYY